MDNSSFIILLICALALIPIAFVVIIRHRHGSLRRGDGTPMWFGMDSSQNNPDLPGSDQPHHHHHHHSTLDGGHHHSHGGGDSGGGHHGGGSDGGAGGGHGGH